MKKSNKLIKLNKDEPKTTRIIIPPEIRRQENPEFRGCTLELDYINLVEINSTEAFKKFVSEHGEVHSDPCFEILNPDRSVDHPNDGYLVIKNQYISFGNLTLTLSGTKHRNRPLVFSNCAFDIKDVTTTFTVGVQQTVVLEDCSFCETSFTAEMEACSRLNLVRCSIDRAIRINGQKYTSFVLDNCDYINKESLLSCNLYTDGVSSVLVSVKMPYSLHFDSATDVNFFNIDTSKSEYDRTVEIHEMAHGFTSAVRFSLCDLKRTNIFMKSSVADLRLDHSYVGTIAIHNSRIGWFYLDSSTVNLLKTVSSFCDQYNTSGQSSAVKTVAASHSANFPETPMTLYKKARLINYTWFGKHSIDSTDIIVKLEVPSYAKKHIDLCSKKIRVSEAKVVEFIGMTNKVVLPKLKYRFDRVSVRSQHDSEFVYKIGKTVTPKHGFADNDETCASGIHGFLDFNEAERY
jgi:hypothetical protein